MQFDLDKSVRYGLAYSGGVDSCYLLAELLREGYDVKAYTILEHMRADGRTVLLDGTNASDREDRRPGFRAIHELGIVSPLRAAGLTKDMVRKESAKLGLPTANKPSYACYGAYFEQGEAITPESLRKTVDKFMSSHPDAADRVRTDGNIEPSPAEAKALRLENERARAARERDAAKAAAAKGEQGGEN